MNDAAGSERSISLAGATGIGVGAIVGGGILALSGVAFQTAGPAAIFAFAMNGLIALLTALSFAEMSTAFPESGGTYTFSKKVLTVEAAFAVGWIVWFASIVAAMLYALGFAAFAASLIARLCETRGWSGPAAWLDTRPTLLLLAAGATLFYSFGLARRRAGGNQWATVGKVIVFAVLIAGGAWAFAG
jgi:APA family basic amino acid/polyamine antiporter